MSNVRTKTRDDRDPDGGGDVPGLNPAIRALTVRALREGYRVLGIRRGWAGLIELDGDRDRPDGDCVIELSEEIVNKVGRTGGTFLHTSRTRPSHVPKANVPEHLRDRYTEDDERPDPRGPREHRPARDRRPDPDRRRRHALLRRPPPQGGGQGHRHPEDDGQRRPREPTTASASRPASPGRSR